MRSRKFEEIIPSHYFPVVTYRNFALAYLPNACNICGYCKYIEVLDVHHKDGDRGNNILSNLEVLCPTCHREIHHLEKKYKKGV